MRTIRRALSTALVALLTALGLIALATPALAHVTAHSHDAKQGGYAMITFRVPTESATASTTKLEVHVPTDTPIPTVSVQPHPGWSFKTVTKHLAKPVSMHGRKITEAVSDIVWTADGAETAIKPGEFDQFHISAGPLPDVATLRFPAIQTYSDGTVVKWIETSAPGSDSEPEHPAPTLTLAAADGKPDPAAAGGLSGDPGGPADPSNSGGGTLPLVLSIVAVVLAAGALGVVIIGRRRAS